MLNVIGISYVNEYQVRCASYRITLVFFGTDTRNFASVTCTTVSVMFSAGVLTEIYLSNWFFRIIGPSPFLQYSDKRFTQTWNFTKAVEICYTNFYNPDRSQYQICIKQTRYVISAIQYLLRISWFGMSSFLLLLFSVLVANTTQNNFYILRWHQRKTEKCRNT